MIKKISLLAITLCLCGCGPRYVWNHPNGGSNFEQDNAQCQYEANRAVGIVPTDYLLVQAMKKNELFEQCMRAKGYYQVNN